MIHVLTIEQAKEWDDIVCSFDNYDVYYLSGYVKAFEIHGDGIPKLFHYEGNGLRALYVFMKRYIADGIYDAITPYGYGGVLFEGDISDDKLNAFWTEYSEMMRNEHVVDNFVRYHPIFANAIPMKKVSKVIDLGKTVAMDLSSPDVIWTNIHSKNRNMIRKAEKNGVEILHGKGMDLLDQFLGIYNATMQKDDAEEYYFFKRPFYESIDRDLHENYEIFYAMYEGRPIAMSIMIFANGRLNYHLSGSDIEYRHLAPTNLLLYKAALWGCEQGMKTFHLGGGVGSGEDNLFKFKKVFNRFFDYQFSIGKEIFDQALYDQLIRERAERDLNFDQTSHFFPLYRA